MPRDSFQAEMDALQEAVLDLGETVQSRLRTAVAALETGSASGPPSYCSGTSSTEIPARRPSRRCFRRFSSCC